MRHLENMNKIILLTGTMVGYAYAMEFFVAWYSGALYEGFVFVNRALGQHSWAYWTMIFCNVVAPQLFWFKRFRTSIPIMFLVVMCVNVGMWFERFVIVLSLEQDFLPSSWAYFKPTWVDIGMLIGSFGLFFTLFLLFLRFLPVIAISEVKAIMPQAHGSHGHHGHGDDHGHGDGGHPDGGSHGHGLAHDPARREGHPDPAGGDDAGSKGASS
jgi:molybdopterin-containing oxidoreductase family membrane subunit